MKVLVIGSGAREHAIAWKLKQSPRLQLLYVCPGNPGIAEIAECHDIKVHEVQKLVDFAKSKSIDLTVVGPEVPLIAGVVDLFREHNLRIFGPTRYCANLEGSKHFAKELMAMAHIPTAAFTHVEDAESGIRFLNEHEGPYVLKADGLAAGKGVVITKCREEAQSACLELFSKYPAGGMLIEQFLSGVEASFIVATDGERIVHMASTHDYKRVLDQDLGPNTGGMGSVCPSPRLSHQQEKLATEHVVRPLLSELAKRGHRFTGFIYAGLMIEPSGKFSVLEFNTRLGDPECQAIMRCMKSDLLSLLCSLTDINAEPNEIDVEWHSEVCVNIVLAAEGYPDAPRAGDQILGIDAARAVPTVEVFHAGTALERGGLVTSGGRVLSVSALGDTVEQARIRAYEAAEHIGFLGRHFRKDIGLL